MGNEPVGVADVMIVDAIVVSVDATLEEADTIMRSTFVTGIPVVDGYGVLSSGSSDMLNWSRTDSGDL